MKIEPGGSGTFCTVFVFSCWCGRESRQVIFGKKVWYSSCVPTRGTTGDQKLHQEYQNFNPRAHEGHDNLEFRHKFHL